MTVSGAFCWHREEVAGHQQVLPWPFCYWVHCLPFAGSALYYRILIPAGHIFLGSYLSWLLAGGGTEGERGKLVIPLGLRLEQHCPRLCDPVPRPPAGEPTGAPLLPGDFGCPAAVTSSQRFVPPA